MERSEDRRDGTPAARSAGSVSIGVLAAFVFIGIVVVALLRSTVSQSGASAGYAAVQEADVTVTSGIIATESYLASAANSENALKMLEDALTGSGAEAPYVCGSDREKVGFSAGQFFSSRLADFNKDKLLARFDVSGGKSAGGRDFGKARAFYRMGNITIEGGSGYGGKNAIYMRGGLVNGDNGMEIFGNATFESSVKFQNSPGIFHGNTFFSENAEFMHPQNKFHGKAYIGGNAVFQNISQYGHQVFDSDVGINGNLSTGNSGTLISAGNVYLGGDFRSQYGGLESNLNLKSSAPSADKNFYYGDGLSVYNPAPSGQTPGSHHCRPSQSSCVLHPGGHVDFNKVSGFANKEHQSGMTGVNIQSALGMSGVSERRDPQLDIGKIDKNLIQSAFSAATQHSALSVKKLHEAYDKAASEDRLYEGHLVLRVGRGDPAINFNEPHDAKFDRKVIFIVEDGAMFNPGGRFYHCTDQSSTMIYAGAGNAKLEQFGSSGLFRGLIYIDSLNTAHNSFNWKTGGSIQGAVHAFSKNNLQWNTGSNNATQIRFDEKVLDAFGPLVKGSTSTKETATFSDKDDKRIHLDPAGFYFH